VHELKIGTVEYFGELYNMDDPLESSILVQYLVEDGVLDTVVKTHHYEEVYYKFNNKELLQDVFREKSINYGYMQKRTVLLNFREIYQVWYN
jgi:hypothetical protein